MDGTGRNNEQILPGLIMHDGLSDWELIDDDGKPMEITDALPKLQGLKLAHLPLRAPVS